MSLIGDFMKYLLFLLITINAYSQVFDNAFTSPFDNAVFDEKNSQMCSFYAFPSGANEFEVHHVIPSYALTDDYDCSKGKYRSCNGAKIATVECSDYIGGCKYADGDIFMSYSKNLEHIKIYQYEDSARVRFYHYQISQPNRVGFCLNNQLKIFHIQR